MPQPETEGMASAAVPTDLEEEARATEASSEAPEAENTEPIDMDDRIDAPPSSESTKTPLPVPTRDRGRTIAFGVLGGSVLLGLALIVRGPQNPPSAANGNAGAPTLTGAEVASASSSPGVAHEAASSTDGGAAPSTAPPAPKFTRVWRVSALKSDTAIEIIEGTLGKRKLEGALVASGIARAEAKRITHAIDGVRRVEKGQPKDTFVVARDRAKGTVTAFEYVTSPLDIWQLKADESAEKHLALKKLELFVEHRRRTAALAITADLAKAISAAGLQDDAASAIDDALEGHVDVATIGGARMRVVGSDEWIEGAYARFHVDALEYVPKDTKNGGTLRVYRYEREREPGTEGSTRRRSSHAGYYDAKGQQPFKGQFRSPLPLARVTSRFNPKRMHPVLHTVMPHNGVDFGASTGTPVYASAPGTVSTAGDSGPCGNMVQVDHAGGLSTAYCHLSKFAPGIHPGQHVEARQLVGYVGQTGRATGPHLHFAVKRGGNFIDPLGIKMDGVRTLPHADREAFAKHRTELDAALDAVSLPVGSSSSPTDDDSKDEPSGEE